MVGTYPMVSSRITPEVPTNQIAELEVLFGDTTLRSRNIFTHTFKVVDAGGNFKEESGTKKEWSTQRDE